MKIAIPSSQPHLDGNIEHKLGTAAYLLIIESENMTFEALPTATGNTGQGAGLAMVSLALDMDAKALLVGHIAPHIAAALRKRSIDVVTGVSTSPRQALQDYIKRQASADGPASEPAADHLPSPASLWKMALRQGGRQMLGMLPYITGVLLLLGLFKGFVSEADLLASLTGGSTLGDVALGGGLGSILAGNPVNSYVIGDGLLRSGVSLAGVMAFMLTWVGVGVLYLPLEASALGWRFTLAFNIATFVFALVMALLGSLLLGGML